MAQILKLEDQKRKHKRSPDALNVMSFFERFPDDQSCEEYLFEQTFPNGFVCSACSCNKYYHLKSEKYTYKCANPKCHKTRSLKTGTAFARSHKSLHQWYYLTYFLTMDKQSISSVLAGKFLEIWDTTAWFMLQKLRYTMQEDRKKYRIGGPEKLVQVDEIEISRIDEGPQKLLVVLEKNNNQEIERVFITPIKKKDISNVLPILSSVLLQGTVVECDGARLYGQLSAIPTIQVEQVSHSQEDFRHAYLQALNTTVGNLKNGILGTFKSVKGKNLGYYCNEFCYRFNRRKKELDYDDCAFFRLLRRSIARPLIRKYREFLTSPDDIYQPA